MSGYGKTTWFFPDADMPPSGEYEIKGHESIIVLNTNEEDVKVTFTLYFENSEPITVAPALVKGNRVRCFRMDNPEDIVGFKIPRETQYAIKLEGNLPIIVQYGRLDPREQPMSFYTNTGYGI